MVTNGVRNAFGMQTQHWSEVVAQAIGSAVGTYVASRPAATGANLMTHDELMRWNQDPAATGAGGADLLPGAFAPGTGLAYSLTGYRASAPAGTGAATPRTHVVRDGESISRIIGTSDPKMVGMVMALNGLKDSTIHSGQVLRLGDTSGLSGEELRSLENFGQAVLENDNRRLDAVRAIGGQSRSMDEQILGGALIYDRKNMDRVLGAGWNSLNESAAEVARARSQIAERAGPVLADFSPIPELRNVYTPREGWGEYAFGAFSSEIFREGNPLLARVGGFLGSVATFVPMVLDATVSGLYNLENNMSLVGQRWGMSNHYTGHDKAYLRIEATLGFTEGFLVVGEVATLGALPKSSAMGPIPVYRSNVANTPDEMGSFTATGSEVFHGPGVTRIGSDEVSIRVAENAARIDGVHDVIVHGVPYDDVGAVFYVDGMPTNANQIADAVLAHPEWNGQPIRLLTCYGGCGPAQELSNILRVPVQAATAPVGVPRVPFSTPVVRQGGQWFDFLPNGGSQ